MKAVCAALGVARSDVHLRAARTDDWIDGRTARVRDHLTCRIVGALEPIVQAHTTEGLVIRGVEGGRAMM